MYIYEKIQNYTRVLLRQSKSEYWLVSRLREIWYINYAEQIQNVTIRVCLVFLCYINMTLNDSFLSSCHINVHNKENFINNFTSRKDVLRMLLILLFVSSPFYIFIFAAFSNFQYISFCDNQIYRSSNDMCNLTLHSFANFEQDLDIIWVICPWMLKARNTLLSFFHYNFRML